MARALFNLSAHCRTSFSLADKKDVHLLECPLKFK
jgi:hypothetical protein